MSGRTDSGSGLRARAAQLNAEVVVSGRSLSSLDFGVDAGDERDGSLLRAMVAESLRWHHRFEWLLARLLDRPVQRLDSRLAALLRIGLTQLAILRVPDHAAVAATVAATEALGVARGRGLVNAVLRRYQRERGHWDAACLGEPVPRFSHPEWLIDRIRQDWPDRAERILDANNQPPPLWLRVNQSRIRRSEYLELLAAADIDAIAGDVADQSVLVATPRPVALLPGFAEGLVSVQDAAAQRVGELLGLAPGQRVLDACAAPGGKTALMLERCPGLGEVVALDADAARLAEAGRNLERLGLSATLVAGRAEAPGDWFDGAPFDRILVDAPCSATGVIRRHPDIKLLRREADIDALTRVQDAMLTALWPLLKPGGRMVYATCSVLKAENEARIEAFAAGSEDLELSRYGSASHFQILPGETNMDGFYYACMVRRVDGDKYKVSAVDL